jgi:Ser/Thr protein kinase RdoA (MazF antagonist)
MLWETVDPGRALRERFGLADLDAAARWVGEVLAAAWGIDVAACRRVVISDQNAIVWVATDRGPLVVKWSRATERFAALERTAELVRDLDDRGIPVAAPVPSRAGRVRQVLPGPAGDLSVTVVPEVAGDWLDVGDLAAVHAAGATMARLHTALAGHLGTDGEGWKDGQGWGGGEVWGTAERITTWLTDTDPGFAPRASRRLAELVASAPEPDDEPQLVHLDFRAANLLTRGSQVVAVLDFDEARVEHRAGDLAKACVYLGTRFTGWRPTPVPARVALRAGYASVRPLSPAQARWSEVLELWHGLLAIPGPRDPAGWAAAAETFVTSPDRP